MKFSALATLALFSTAAAAPRLTTADATADQLKSLGTRLLSALKNPATFNLNQFENCRKIIHTQTWSCFISDRSPRDSALRYTAESVKAILENAKATKGSGIDLSKVVATSQYFENRGFFLDSGSYELRGIFKDAHLYNFFYGPGCMATENKSFPSKFKGMTVDKYMPTHVPIKEEFRRALDKANLANMEVPCIKVFMFGSQDIGESTNFGEEERNAPLEGVAKF
jgi:hypothetical protein